MTASASRTPLRRSLLCTTAIVGLSASLVIGLSVRGAAAQAVDWVGGTSNYNDDAQLESDGRGRGADTAGESATFSGNGSAAVDLQGLATYAPDSWAISGTRAYTITNGTVNLSAA